MIHHESIKLFEFNLLLIFQKNLYLALKTYGILISHGIGLIPTYGGTDKWGCTKAVINRNEFWLNELNYSDNHIMFDEAVNGSHNSDGLIEEIAKAVGGKTVTVTRTDFCTSEKLLYMYYYEDDTDEVTYITIDLLFCKSEDLSTAYKAYINYRGHVNTNFIKKVIHDLDLLK